MSKIDDYTSSGAKFFANQEAMLGLRNGKAKVVTCHIMATDHCNASCGFCSVHHREGSVLPFSAITGFIDELIKHGLRSTIVSGGGNPILWKCKETGKNFNDLIDFLHGRGLQIGVISNGMPLKLYPDGRESWMTVKPETLDKITWIRISMAGLDHDEREVYVPDVDQGKTTLGFSYCAHDVHYEPLDKAHGKVSTEADMITIGLARSLLPPSWMFESRIGELTNQLAFYAKTYSPRYIRMLPNCLEPNMIDKRCDQLEAMAKVINFEADAEVAFVQRKPPKPFKACYLGYIHPVLNSDGYVLPCDSCCLNESAGHKLGEAWRICHWSDIGKLYADPVRSLIKNPLAECPGCVFGRSNEILSGVVDGTADITPPASTPEHVYFV